MLESYVIGLLDNLFRFLLLVTLPGRSVRMCKISLKLYPEQGRRGICGPNNHDPPFILGAGGADICLAGSGFGQTSEISR